METKSDDFMLYLDVVLPFIYTKISGLNAHFLTVMTFVVSTYGDPFIHSPYNRACYVHMRHQIEISVYN